jgi:chromosome segregation ATPase
MNADEFASALGKIAVLEKGMREMGEAVTDLKKQLTTQRRDHDELDDRVDEHDRQIERVINAQLRYDVTSGKIFEKLDELVVMHRASRLP